ncbi:MAG: hypothetical protein HYV14_01890 [Elusimicrobia bacterium]|nr:hypothetical protein [Elusimicrobiota bacterium]
MIQAPLKTVGVDYPRAGETLAPGQDYSFRVTAPSDAKEVRLSIDDGEWKPCRMDAGYWWFDWTPQDEGDHIAVSRVIEADGSMLVTQPRLFTVRG